MDQTNDRKPGSGPQADKKRGQQDMDRTKDTVTTDKDKVGKDSGTGQRR